MAALAVALLALVFYRCGLRRGEAEHPGDVSAADGASHDAESLLDTGPVLPLGANEVIEDAGPFDASSNALLIARWGAHRDELGREGRDGKPEGPMSLAFAGRDLLVLDQVNGRLVRYSSDGHLRSTSDAPKSAQDVAVGKDGTVAIVDRLVEKNVTLVDAKGRKVGALPLEGRVPEPALVTGVVIDGKDVYVEKEHGAFVLLGGTDGAPASQPATLTGRPSKDGSLLLTVGLASPEQGRASLDAVDRKTAARRFARTVVFPGPAHRIVLLDTDAKGTIYLGVAAGDPGDAQISCLDPGDGHVLGRVVLPLSHTPEESFRDFTVGDDGTIAFAIRTADDVQYRTARCP